MSLQASNTNTLISTAQAGTTLLVLHHQANGNHLTHIGNGNDGLIGTVQGNLMTIQFRLSDGALPPLVNGINYVLQLTFDEIASEKY